MKPERVKELIASLARLRQEGEALAGQAGDFPALERNCRRLLASVRMMEIDLGLTTVPQGPGIARLGR